MKVRELAYRTLRMVERRKFVPREEVNRVLSRLNDRDRAFFKELVWGTLRRTIYLDWLIDRHLKNPQIPPSIRIALRMGAYQLIFMDSVPKYAAVSETVKLVKNPSFKGLINAVLRRISEEEYIDPPNVHLKYSHPEWISKMLVENFGREIAVRIMENHMKPAPLTLRVNTLKISRDELLSRRDLNLKPSSHSPVGLILNYNGPIGELDIFKRGYVSVQSISSQIVSFVLKPEKGERILDMCASPGGKTTHIAELMEDEGEIVALDRDLESVEKIVANTERLGLKSVKTAVMDARKVPEVFEEPFDKILLDAPCSSLGTARKNPEVLLRVREKDVRKLARLQSELMESGWRVLKEGGVLLYGTCTFTPQENTDNVKRFLLEHKDAESIDIRKDLENFGVELFWDGYGALILPDEELTEFYLSVLFKKS